MARRSTPFDDKRARIAALGASPSATTAAELRRFLGDRSGYVVGEAAEVAAKLELRELVPDLVAALTRLFGEGLAADKGCLGKRRILEALLGFEANEPAVYLVALRFVQLEPSWGKPVDTAAPLRGLAAHALVQIDARDALAEITPLLVDPETSVRVEAAHALGRSGLEGAAAVLHLKVLGGDRELDVLQGAYAALLRLDSRRYLAVARAVLAKEDDASEAVALALGESRLPDALVLLREALEASGSPALDRSLLMGLSLLRMPEAIDALLAEVANAPVTRATSAIAALALHRHDEAVVARARRAVEERASKTLAEALRAQLEP